MLTVVALSVVWFEAMIPVVITKEPTVTSVAEAAAPDFVYVVDPPTSTVCQKPCSSVTVIEVPLTAWTVPAR